MSPITSFSRSRPISAWREGGREGGRAGEREGRKRGEKKNDGGEERERKQWEKGVRNGEENFNCKHWMNSKDRPSELYRNQKIL